MKVTVIEEYVKLADKYRQDIKEEKWSIHDTKQLANFARWIEERNGGSVDNAPLRAMRVELKLTQDRLRVVAIKSMRRKREIRRILKAITWYNNFIYHKQPLRQVLHWVEQMERGEGLTKHELAQMRQAIKHGLEK